MNEQRFLTSYVEAPRDTPGLVMESDGTVAVVTPTGVRVALGATDAVTTFTHIEDGTQPPLLPILAVDVDAQTLAVGGDQTHDGNLLASVPNGAAMLIAGSTGNDGPYMPSATSYDPDSDRTTYVLDTFSEGSLSSPVADGTLQLPIIWVSEIDLAPNAAVEWVLIDTTVEWSSTFYGVVGDDDNPEGFCGGIGPSPSGGANVATVGRYQWPLNTTSKVSSSPVTLIGTYPAYQFYPDGATVRIVWTEPLGTTAGSSRIIVHHHFTDTITPTRIP